MQIAEGSSTCLRNRLLSGLVQPCSTSAIHKTQAGPYKTTGTDMLMDQVAASSSSHIKVMQKFVQ